MSQVNPHKLSPQHKNVPSGIKVFFQQWQLQIMVIPAMICFFIFAYMPFAGMANAFLDYRLTDGFFGKSFAGLKYFRELFADKDFFLALRNTFGMSLVKFAFTFAFPILFALLLNELPSMKLKRIAQTGSYLPHFISYVIVATLWMIFLDRTGPVNDILMALGVIQTPIEFLTESKWFWWIGMVIDCWQETGWNAIIYLAAISAISPEVYEAAAIDGAGWSSRMFRITLPAISGTIISLFILNVGSLLNGGAVGSNFNQSYLLGNAFNRETSYVLQTLVVHTGLNQFRFSFAAAANLILSVISMVLLFSANKVSKKVFHDGII